MSYYNYKNKSEKEKEEEDDPLATIGKAVGVVAGAAFAAWGISKLFSSSSESSESSSSKKNVMEPLEEDDYIYNQVGKAAVNPTLSIRHVDPYAGMGVSFQGLEVVKWSLPEKGWLKLNTDASRKTKPNSPYISVAIGGVFRDDEGEWVQGFAGKILSCDVHEAELFAIREGLKIAWNSNYDNIEVETDCDSAERLFNGTQKPSNDLEVELVRDCINLRQRNWSVRVKHLRKEANEVADRLAELGHRYDETTTFEDPPDDKRLGELLVSDKEKVDLRATNTLPWLV